MKRAFSMLALWCAAALMACGAAIDGKWTARFERKDPQKGVVTVEFLLELKAEGGKLTGSVTRTAGRRSLSTAIENGKIEGDRFSFITVQKSAKGEQKFLWEGVIAGDELKGTRQAEGRRRGAPFTAKRNP